MGINWESERIPSIEIIHVDNDNGMLIRLSVCIGRFLPCLTTILFENLIKFLF